MNLKKTYIAQIANGVSIHSDDLNDADFDIVSISDTEMHILYKHTSYTAKIISRDLQNKTYIFEIAGERHQVTLKDELDMLIDKMGMNTSKDAEIKDLKAPMPGLILHIEVSTGDEVTKDQKLFVLEAMKMENIIKSPRDGKITKVSVEKGDKVEKGQLLLTYE